MEPSEEDILGGAKQKTGLVRGSRGWELPTVLDSFTLSLQHVQHCPIASMCCLTQDQRPKAKGQTMNTPNSEPEQTLLKPFVRHLHHATDKSDQEGRSLSRREDTPYRWNYRTTFSKGKKGHSSC